MAIASERCVRSGAYALASRPERPRATSSLRGLVKLHVRVGHRVEILPRLWLSYDRGIAGGMYLHDLIYVAATRTGAQAVARQPEPSSLAGWSRPLERGV